MNRVLTGLSIFFLLAQTSVGQTTQSGSTPPVRRDTQAVSLVQQSIEAMGGVGPVGQIQTVVAMGTIASVPGSSDASGNVTMEDSFSAQGHEFKDSFQSSSLTQSFVSGHGNPGGVTNGRIRPYMPQIANFRLPLHLPALILAQCLGNANCNMEFVGQTTYNGASAIQIHLHVDTDIVQQTLSIQDWYFDPATALPIRVEYRLPDTSLSLYYVSAAADFSNFKPIQGIIFPFTILSYRDGTPRSVLTLNSVTINQPVNSADFNLPSVSAGVSQ